MIRIPASFLPFQETVKRKRKHGIEAGDGEDFRLQVFIFDLLYLDGKDYLNKRIQERREKLLEIFAHLNDDNFKLLKKKK